MMALFNAVEVIVPGSKPMRVIDYQTPLPSTAKTRIGKVDGLGLLGDGHSV